MGGFWLYHKGKDDGKKEEIGLKPSKIKLELIKMRYKLPSTEFQEIICPERVISKSSTKKTESAFSGSVPATYSVKLLLPSPSASTSGKATVEPNCATSQLSGMPSKSASAGKLPLK